MADVYFDQEEQEGRAFVPVESATTEAEAREHLLAELTDSIDRETLREAVLGDWQYRGVESIEVCEHDFGERHRKGCRRTIQGHVFEFDLAPVPA